MTEYEVNICKRFKEIRLYLNLKQKKYSEEIKTTQGHVSDIENFRKPVSERLIVIICLKFDINETWFRTGEGEMLEYADENPIVAKATILLGERDPIFEAFVDTYSKLDRTSRDILISLGRDLSKASKDTLVSFSKDFFTNLKERE